jgi:hypothetical protein
VAEITCCRYEDLVKALTDETRQGVLELVQERDGRTGDCRVVQPDSADHLLSAGLLRRDGLVVALREEKRVYYMANRCCPESCTRPPMKPLTGDKGES